MPFHTDRREFLVLAAGSLLTVTRFGPVASPIRVGVVGAPADGPDPRLPGAADGLRLGIEEAGRTAAMFGREADFVFATAGRDAADASAVASGLLDGGCAALVTLLDGAPAAQAAAAATARGKPCVHLLAVPVPGAASPEASAAFYVMPPRELRAAALLRELDGTTRPLDGLAEVVLSTDDAADATATLAAAGGARFEGTVLDLSGVTESLPQELLPARVVRADVWTPHLVRFGAAQLNDRFRARFGSGATMHGPAWAGWFAAKILVETALRGRSADGPALADALRRARFDGHKGTPLSFAPDGHLEQPLYVVGLAGREPR